MTKKISVLLPTRGRIEGLRNAVNSLMDQAHDASSVEILLRTDYDDTPALGATLPDRPEYREIRGERWGYIRMCDYYGQLASLAEGQLLFVWNDDTEMLTHSWDRLLLEQAESPKVQFIRRNILETADDTFPIVDRRIYTTLGHLSLHCAVDTWMSIVSKDAGVRLFRNDIVFHHHRWEDQTGKEGGAAARAAMNDFYSNERVAQRAADSVKIRTLLGAA